MANAVLGTMLMMGLMMSMLPGALLAVQEGRELAEAQADHARAERERAELAAWCARNPNVGPPDCPFDGPMPGHECRPVAGDAWLCTRQGSGGGNVTAPEPQEGKAPALGVRP